MLKPVGRVAVALIAFVVCAGFGSGERLFAPGADLWERWQVHDAASDVRIDHSAWDEFLRRYVVVNDTGVNLVDYRGVSADDRSVLEDYLSILELVPISRYSRAEQLAYWINLYNALTVRVVLDHYPVDSIRDIDISPGLFADGPWGKKLVMVEGEALSLNDIEHRILRPIWRDNRIHYAVNCASIGCPDLQPTAFTASNADSLLTKAARGYINSPRGISISGDTVTVSKIYDWFYEDFGRTDRDVLDHLLTYAEPALKQKLQEIGEIHEVAYDWRLNGATR